MIRDNYSISTHASLAGRDCRRDVPAAGRRRFQPTRPLRDATALSRREDYGTLEFQPTRPLRDATMIPPSRLPQSTISTHASLAGRDENTINMIDAQERISTHASLAGRDRRRGGNCGVYSHFNPRVPCGTRLARGRSLPPRVYFNPRVPCGTRLIDRRTGRRYSYFNPRVPCGTRRWRRGNPQPVRHFNPRVPCGTRRSLLTAIPCRRRLFQPTRPLRDATKHCVNCVGIVLFQPTRPLRDATANLTRKASSDLRK